MTRSEQSRQLLFSGLDGLVMTERISQQQADSLKIYARYWVDDMIAEATQGIQIVPETPAIPTYEGQERRKGGRVPLAVQMKAMGL